MGKESDTTPFLKTWQWSKTVYDVRVKRDRFELAKCPFYLRTFSYSRISGINNVCIERRSHIPKEELIRKVKPNCVVLRRTGPVVLVEVVKSLDWGDAGTLNPGVITDSNYNVYVAHNEILAYSQIGGPVSLVFPAIDTEKYFDPVLTRLRSFKEAQFIEAYNKYAGDLKHHQSERMLEAVKIAYSMLSVPLQMRLGPVMYRAMDHYHQAHSHPYLQLGHIVADTEP